VISRRSRNFASFKSGPATSGLRYFPISATVLNDDFMAALDHKNP
jgi:hypothetical protein